MFALLEHTLQRFFSTFPGGAAGVGLLFLRIAVGTDLLAGGFGAIGTADPVWAWSGVFAVVIIAAGALLLAGFLTPPVAGMAAAVCACLTVFGPRLALQGETASTHHMVFLAIICVSVTLLGPGAYSVDARMFGRREILVRTPSRIDGT